MTVFRNQSLETKSPSTSNQRKFVYSSFIKWVSVSIPLSTGKLINILRPLRKKKVIPVHNYLEIKAEKKIFLMFVNYF